ncbi:mCG147806 [Mus musculus]|nr:mCG147806 [Mus musculus]
MASQLQVLLLFQRTHVQFLAPTGWRLTTVHIHNLHISG